MCISSFKSKPEALFQQIVINVSLTRQLQKDLSVCGRRNIQIFNFKWKL